MWRCVLRQDDELDMHTRGNAVTVMTHSAAATMSGIQAKQAVFQLQMQDCPSATNAELTSAVMLLAIHLSRIVLGTCLGVD